ncbi:MAG: ATPase [Chlorobiaceae bacterium]|nr:ATPase [Chlorobiaceae bacterium]
MTTQQKRIATVATVTSGNITAVFADDAASLASPNEQIGKLGSYVMIPSGNYFIIGTISSTRYHDLAAAEDKLSLKPAKKIIEIQLIGTLCDGRFTRGVSSFPILGSPVYLAAPEELKNIFATYRQSNFSLGSLSIMGEERLYLEPNKFFAKHIALFGSTGSGKSCTTASIIQKIHKFENSHVILLDLHGEYEPAFKEQGNIIKITELELPYWLMNFDELCETFVDEDDPHSHNQMMIMKDAVLDSKRGKNLNLKEFLTIDTPVYFDFLEVFARMRSLDTERTLSGKEGPFYGQFTRFLVRLESKIQDKRYEFLFKPKKYKSSETFSELLTQLFGIVNNKQVTVLDLSRVPFDVINVLVSLLGRIIFDFNLWNQNRQNFPVLIVFEEAHTYLSSQGRSVAARKTVERISKEGRKYGVSCMIVSQRPSEISETITAQCNNFIALRLLNPNDQNYVRKLVPDALASLIDVLPTLGQGEAFVIGDAVAIPARVQIDMPSPAPASGDIKFFNKWLKKEADTSVLDVVNNWWKQIRS